MLLLAEQIDHGCLEGIFTKSSLTEVRPSWRCTLELRTSCVSAVGTGQIANSIHCASDFFFLMVNSLYMVFSFTYEPKDFYVDNALLWTRQTKKKVLASKINSGKKSQCVM